MLCHCLKLGLRLRYLILHVLQANVRKYRPFFNVITSSNVANPPIRSLHQIHSRYITGGAEREINLGIRND